MKRQTWLTSAVKRQTWLTSAGVAVLPVVASTPVFARIVSTVVDILLAEVPAVARSTLAVEISDRVPTLASVLTWVFLKRSLSFTLPTTRFCL